MLHETKRVNEATKSNNSLKEGIRSYSRTMKSLFCALVDTFINHVIALDKKFMEVHELISSGDFKVEVSNLSLESTFG